MNTKPTAIDAYLARAAAIHIKLARLQQLADDHFGHDSEAIVDIFAAKAPRSRADHRLGMLREML